MGKYSVKGSADFDALVASHLEHIANEVYASSYAKHWNALVLTGGYGRGEGTPQIFAGQGVLPTDGYQLVIVTQRIDPLIRSALRHLEASLSNTLHLPIEITPYLKKTLSKCDFSLKNVDLKQGHQVIRGDEEILSALPNYSADHLPLTEGTRRLLTYGTLLLNMKHRISQAEVLSTEEREQFVKILFKTELAFGDCALLLRNAYAPSSSIKKERIKTVNITGLDNGTGIVNATLRALEFNECGDFHTLKATNVHMWLNETIRQFENFFLWYERRRLNRTFRTIRKYTQTFPYLGKEGFALKNAVYNLRTFGFAGIPYLFTHPRLRLYATIPLLLSPQPDLNDLRKLLGSRKRFLDELELEFLSIQKRFS